MGMTNQPVLDLYARKAKLYQHFFIGFLQWEKVLEAFFLENNYLHSGMKVLDAGCGTGPVTGVLYTLARRQGLEQITFHGFDLTPAMLDLFREWMDKEGMQDIELRQADVLSLKEQLPQDWNSYDLIVSAAMLEYIPREKLNQALENLKRLLHEKGRLLLFVTRRALITRLFGAKWWGTSLFSYDELQAKLRESGFPKVQIKSLPGFWDKFILAVEASN